LNSISWILFAQRLSIGKFLEQALSVGRIAVILLAVLIFFSDIIALYSPVGVVIWTSLAQCALGFAAWRLLTWWFFCGALLTLELLFFRAVSEALRETR
jgi:hypothetical protein